MRKGVLLVVVWVVGCAKPAAMEVDSGVPEEVAFEGEAPANLPDFTDGVVDGGQNTPFDAGPIVTETKCCKLRFNIGGAGEPSGATGRLVGEALPLSVGIALTSDADGGFSAQACFPVNTSSYYWYEFEWPTSDPDAGGVALPDGGFLVRVERFSASETNYPAGPSGNRNFIPSVNDCAQLDAGTGP